MSVMSTKLLVAPISGGGFVVQVAFVRALSKIGFRPSVILSASGGGVASFIANCCDWDPERIDKLVLDLSSNTFVLRPFSLVSLLAFPFRLSLYYKSPYLSRFVDRHVPKDQLSQPVEHWALTINTTKSVPQMSCNFAEGTTSFDPSEFSSFVKTYNVKGGVHEMAEVIYASAAIPFAVQPGSIDGDQHVDGGMWMPSSLSLLSTGLSYSQLKLQIVYLSSYNVFMGNIGTSIATGAVSVHIHATCLTDVERGIDLLRIRSGGKYTVDEQITEDNLSEWLSANEDKEFFLYCFPDEPVSVNPVSFTGREALRVVNSVVMRFKAWIAV